jgi:hypothetical protein
MFLARVRPLQIILLFLCMSIASLVAFSPSALAASANANTRASDPITITSQTDKINYPTSIDFHMSASDTSSPITSATIYIMFNAGGYQEQHAIANLRPGRTISTLWHEDTTGDNFHTAGSHVSYYWQLGDSAGHTHTDTAQQFTTIDTRFSWQHLSQGMLQVDWYNRSQDFGNVLLNQASASLERISQKLGGRLLRPINLWVYATDEDFHGSLAPNSYEWVGGQAHPSLDEASIVVQDTSDETLVRDMPHELTHLVFHQLTEKGIGNYTPIWFDEGLAVYNQAYQEPEMTARLQKALNSQSLLRLDSISYSFPSNADLAYLAYAQSWNLLDYMYTTFGQPRMVRFISLLNNIQSDFGEDLERALGVDQIHLENQWHLKLHQPALIPPDQPTPTPTARPAQKPKQSQSIQDTSSTPLLLLGSALVLGSGIIMILVIVNMRRRRQNTWAVQTAQEILASSLSTPTSTTSWQQNNGVPPSNSRMPYTHPSTYMPFPPQPPLGQNKQTTYRTPEQAFGAPPPDMPPISRNDPWDYPDANRQELSDRRNAGGSQGAGEPLSPFVPGQESPGQKPGWHPSQE